MMLSKASIDSPPWRGLRKDLRGSRSGSSLEGMREIELLGRSEGAGEDGGERRRTGACAGTSNSSWVSEELVIPLL